jgi:hypothetical protein
MNFGKFLSELFQTDPNWEFMPHPDFPTEYRVALTKGGSRVFLNGFGDGIRFCIVLVATCMLSRALKTKTRLIDSFCSYIELRERRRLVLWNANVGQGRMKPNLILSLSVLLSI